MGLAYRDVIMHRQTFVDEEFVPSYKQRCEELKQSLKQTRPQEHKSDEKKIIKVAIGLKCMERTAIIFKPRCLQNSDI